MFTDVVLLSFTGLCLLFCIGVKFGLSHSGKNLLKAGVWRIFVTERKGMTGSWRKLHSEKLDLCSSPDVITVIRSRRLRWTGHVTHAGEKR